MFDRSSTRDNDFSIKTDIEALIVRKVDNATHWTNVYSSDNKGAQFTYPTVVMETKAHQKPS